MAPVIRPASAIDATARSNLGEGSTTSKPGKRHTDEAPRSPSPPADDNDDVNDDDEDDEDLSLLRSNKKSGGEGTVSKRTLQNRKAQREFRKRREARVRELEERCRRFDQMGLEANTELQRIARNLKEENEALRAFVARLGLGSVLSNIVQAGVQQQQQSHMPQQQTLPNGNFQQHQQNAFNPASFSDFYTNGGNIGHSNQVNEPNFYVDNTNTAMSSMMGRNRSNTVSGSRHLSQDELRKGQVGMTLAPAPQQLQEQQRARKGSNSSPSSAKSGDQDSETPLLSLSLGQGQEQPNSKRQRDLSRTRAPQQQQQQQPTFTMPIQQNNQQQSRPWSSAASQNVSTNDISGQPSSALSGTAMLGNLSGSNFAPFPVPQRSHQNAALLNPNPIPFAFNFSSTSDADQQQQAGQQQMPQATATWWDEVGSNLEPIELDEKAQAVASAQSGLANQQGQSPFDLSAFLTGGITPGGGFQFGQHADNQDDSVAARQQQHGEGKVRAAAATPDTAHMRLFVQLMERKVAERDARTYASLGFQPPSQDPAHRKSESHGTPINRSLSRVPSSGGSRNRSASIQFTPSNAYTRLAQHPAFLSTSARELEELVNTLEPADSPTSKGEGKAKQQSAPSGRQKSPDSVGNNGDADSIHGHVDEGAIGKMLGLLDQKRDSIKTESTDGDQNLSMVMT